MGSFPFVVLVAASVPQPSSTVIFLRARTTAAWYSVLCCIGKSLSDHCAVETEESVHHNTCGLSPSLILQSYWEST